MAGRPTPFDVICSALAPEPTRGHLEDRAHSVIGMLTRRGYAIADLASVERDRKLIDEMGSTLTVLVMMIEQVVDETNLDEERTNLTIIAGGQVIATLSLAEALRQASAAVATAEARG